MRRSATPPLLEPEQESLQISSGAPAIAETGRQRSVVTDRPARHASTDPAQHMYRTVLACSLDDEAA